MLDFIDMIERMPNSARWRVTLRDRENGAIVAIIENLLENEVADLYLDILDETEMLCQ